MCYSSLEIPDFLQFIIGVVDKGYFKFLIRGRNQFDRETIWGDFVAADQTERARLPN